LFEAARAWSPGEHISVEHLVSGVGLARLYRFCGRQQATADSLLDWQDPQLNAWLVTTAQVEVDSVQARTLRLFARLIAREAANLALQNWCDGGVVITGGLAIRIAEFLSENAFIEAFVDKGTYQTWLASWPVRLCTNADAPLWGLHPLALQDC
jgi:glucokinase